MRTNTDRTKRVFLNLVGGQWAEQVKEGTPNAVQRTNKKDKVVYELLSDRCSGVIKEMKIEKNDYGKHLVILMDDIGESYNISIPVDSKFFDSFCSKIGSANLHSNIELAPYSFESKEGNRVMGMNLYQNGQKLGYYFSVEDPKGKPFNTERLDDEDWKVFKIQERKFYCEYISNIKGSEPQESTPSKSGDDLPF